MTYVSICGDDFMTYGVFIVAQLLPKPPGFGLNRLACKLINPHYFIYTCSNISKRCARPAAQRLVHKLGLDKHGFGLDLQINNSAKILNTYQVCIKQLVKFQKY